MTNLFDELKWRGLVYDHTEDLPELLATQRIVAYIGFDPTASSLHVGSLLTVMGLARLQRFGHTPIAIVGGGTGMIGDPSGKLESEEGISFTEFSYLVLQAYDFLQLFDRDTCVLQMGGSDQWGNITAGIELIRRRRVKKAHGLVWPLMKTASGAKFGKTEAGAIWLDPARTSPFAFYQFWLNTDDREVVSYLKSFTFLEQPAIAELERSVEQHPEQREAQKVLARNVTALVHGQEQLARVEHASGLLFGEEITSLSVNDVLAVFADVPSTELPSAELPADGVALVDLLVRVHLAASKSEARRLVQSGGTYVNNRRVSDPQLRLTRDQAIGGTLFVIRKGQKQNHLLRLT
jgi:tyrosyl-tRNA synthetase